MNIFYNYLFDFILLAELNAAWSLCCVIVNRSKKIRFCLKLPNRMVSTSKACRYRNTLYFPIPTLKQRTCASRIWKLDNDTSWPLAFRCLAEEQAWIAVCAISSTALLSVGSVSEFIVLVTQPAQFLGRNVKILSKEASMEYGSPPFPFVTAHSFGTVLFVLSVWALEQAIYVQRSNP